MYEYNVSFIVVEQHMFVDECKASDEGEDESEKELYMPRAP